jgi:hypothetical protein
MNHVSLKPAHVAAEPVLVLVDAKISLADAFVMAREAERKFVADHPSAPTNLGHDTDDDFRKFPASLNYDKNGHVTTLWFTSSQSGLKQEFTFSADDLCKVAAHPKIDQFDKKTIVMAIHNSYCR